MATWAPTSFDSLGAIRKAMGAGTITSQHLKRAAESMRRSRELRAAGLIIVKAICHEIDLTEVLISKGYLPAALESDRVAIDSATSEMLATVLRYGGAGVPRRTAALPVACNVTKPSDVIRGHSERGR